LEGDHNLENIATALAVGKHFGISPEAAEQAIARYKPQNNRSEWRETARNKVLLDAYNANPSSMVATLDYFAEAMAAQEDLQGALIVLGEMGELGLYSAAGHQEVAEVAIRLAADLPGFVLLVGTPWAEAMDQLQAPENVVCCADSTDAAHWIEGIHPAGQTILLKGSRSVALENLLPLL
jgi:UDP-N-acetylmuramoyl-tripeptide--D-alanyl-D-alanine ligase